SSFLRNISQRHRATRSATRARAKRARPLPVPIKSRHRSLPKPELPRSARNRAAEQPALDESGLHLDNRARTFLTERSVDRVSTDEVVAITGRACLRHFRGQLALPL